MMRYCSNLAAHLAAISWKTHCCKVFVQSWEPLRCVEWPSVCLLCSNVERIVSCTLHFRQSWKFARILLRGLRTCTFF